MDIATEQKGCTCELQVTLLLVHIYIHVRIISPNLPGGYHIFTHKIVYLGRPHLPILGQYSAKVYTVPKYRVPNHENFKTEIPDSTNAVSSQKTKSLLLEPVRLSDDRRPQRLGQSSFFDSFAKKDWDSTLWRASCKNAVQSQSLRGWGPKPLRQYSTFVFLSCENPVLSHFLRN